jgi:transposase, IS5 family
MRPEERKSRAGRKPWDEVVMFKAIVLCELYNLSDDQVEYQLRGAIVKSCVWVGQAAA